MAELPKIFKKMSMNFENIEIIEIGKISNLSPFTIQVGEIRYKSSDFEIYKPKDMIFKIDDLISFVDKTTFLMIINKIEVIK